MIYLYGGYRDFHCLPISFILLVDYNYFIYYIHNHKVLNSFIFITHLFIEKGCRLAQSGLKLPI